MPSAEPEYIGCAEQFVPAGEGRALALRPDGGVVRLEDPLPQILEQCDRFRTARGHVQHLLDAGWPDEAARNIEAGINGLIREGLLLAKADFVRALAERERPSDVPAIAIAAWVTRDRPDLLARSVESLVAVTRAGGRPVRYAVFDDSGKPKAAPFTADLVDISRKRAFLAELLRTRADLPPALAEFALFDPHGFGMAAGANRNSLLLGTVGDLVMCSDDDIVHRFVASGEPGTLELYSFHDPASVRSYRDRAEMLNANARADVDIVGWHERLLGRTVSACVAAAGPALLADRAAPVLVRRLLKSDPVVLAAAAGIAGDCGLAAPRYLLTLAGDDREAIVSPAQSYAIASSSREMVRVVKRLTITEGRSFMAGCSALDNRDLLPPFFPVGRNEDGVFAAVLRAAVADGMVGHLPLAVLHDPPGARSFPEGALRTWAPRISDTVIMLLEDRSQNALPQSRAEGLARTGAYLKDVAALAAADFSLYLRDRWMHGLSAYIEHLEDLLRIYSESPDHWAADVRAHIDSVIDALTTPGGLVPIDLRSGRSPDEAMELCRAMVREYGELLVWWPAIVEAARGLREAGLGMLPPRRG